ncbi:MAG: hypothetical protein ABFR65_06650 [Pseudomonadota bacterium]
MTRQALVLGLLNRHSLLYRQKQGQGSYRGARWDSAGEVVNTWLPMLTPSPKQITMRTAIFLPQGTPLAQWLETWIPNPLPWGGFLVAYFKKYQDVKIRFLPTPDIGGAMLGPRP